MALGTALARATIGGLFVGHGAQKLFGSFGGHGPEGTGRFFEQLGLRPGRRNAIAAGAAEAGGGALLVLGLFTPAAAAALIATMATAIRTVHLPRGPWIAEGGYEYNLVVIASLLAIVETGPGKLSLDAARGREHGGPVRMLAALGAGMAGSALAIEAGRRLGDEQPAGADEPATSSANGAEPAQPAEVGSRD